MANNLHRLLLGAAIAALVGGDVAAAETMTPMERVTSTPRGQLKSPYMDFSSVAEDGRKLFQANDCGGCHGGGGGGGWRHLSPMRFGSTAAMMTPCSASSRSAPEVSAPGMPSRSKASCAKAPRMLLGRCPPMVRSSRGKLTSGKSLPGSGRRIASGTLRDADVSACIWSPSHSHLFTRY